MQNKYPFFKYVPKESSFHMMNSTMKIAWFLLTLLAVLLIRDYKSLLIILFDLTYVMRETGVKIDGYLSNIIMIWPLYAVIGIIVLLISFNVSLAILSMIKVMLVILLFLILTFTTSLSEIAWGFECLFKRLKKIHVPVSKISLNIALVIKFVATLFEQFRTVRRSMAYRGVPYNTNPYKIFKNMFIPVIMVSYKLSARKIASMKLRFYGYSNKRTNYHENKTTKFDKILIITSMVLVYITISLGWIN